MEPRLPTDPLAALLRVLRVQGAVYFVQNFSAPWGMRIPMRAHAQFHFVVNGSCCFSVDSVPFRAEKGDLILFPRGAAHTCFDGPMTDLMDGRELVQATIAGNPPFQRGPTTVQLLSGHFEFDREAKHPLTEALPELLHVAVADKIDTTLFTSLFPLLKQNIATQDVGNETILARLCEVFLVQALRSHVRQTEPDSGLLQAFFDPRLGRVIAHMHERCSDRFTVKGLARLAGMSRSVFSERFTRAAHTSPMAYLAHWRLLKARSLLLTTKQSVAEIAQATGHGSTESFSRSFKELYGVNPSGLRKSVVSHNVS